MNKKIVISIIVLVLSAAGGWLVFRDKEPAPRALVEKVVGVHYVGGGKHVIEGTVMLPNPCYALSVTSEKKGGTPEEVLLRFLAEQTAQACVQVIDEVPFHIAFEAADNVTLSAVINDMPMALELERRQRINANTGESFTLTANEERWIDDLKVTFLGVEDDSRCPFDVTCIQAGWITTRIQIGDQQVRLRLPGDASVPNAAVAGSYIVTLVEVTPYPKSTEKINDYTATLRVEVHDVKG